MTRDETISLFNSGKAAWNTWAASMLTERDRLKKPDVWEARRKDWEERAKVNFDGCTFKKDIDFDGFTFPGESSFVMTQFLGRALFRRARFYGNVLFDCNILKNIAISF
jgi:hypothetical protein